MPLKHRASNSSFKSFRFRFCEKEDNDGCLIVFFLKHAAVTALNFNSVKASSSSAQLWLILWTLHGHIGEFSWQQHGSDLSLLSHAEPFQFQSLDPSWGIPNCSPFKHYLKIRPYASKYNYVLGCHHIGSGSYLPCCVW